MGDRDKLSEDTKRLDALEDLLWSTQSGNGIAIMPVLRSQTGERSVDILDLGDEDGSNLGDTLGESVTLRDAIDDVIRELAEAS